MNQKTNSFGIFFRRLLPAYKSKRSRTLFITVIAGSYLLIFTAILLTGKFVFFYSQKDVEQFESGKPAPRSITVDHNLQYTDQRATETRREAVAQLVPPVYVVRGTVIGNSIAAFSDFSSILTESLSENMTAEKSFLKMQTALPDIMDQKAYYSLYNHPGIIQLLPFFQIILSDILNRGYIENAENPLDGTPVNRMEIILRSETEKQGRAIPFSEIFHTGNVEEYISRRISEANLPDNTFIPLRAMFDTFGRTNLFYDEDATENLRVTEKASVAPVVRNLIRGETIVTKGMTVRENDLEKIRAISEFSVSVNTKIILGTAFFLALIYLLAFLLIRPPFTEFRLNFQQVLIITVVSVLYVVLAAVLYRLTDVPEWLPYSLILPTALSVMLISILISYRTGILTSLLLSFTTLLITDMSIHTFLFAVLSSVSGAIIIKDTEKRIELVRVGLYLAAVNLTVSIVLGFFNGYGFKQAAEAGVWAFLHGIFSGVLLLGILPIMEYIFNSATKFRLMELSDLNNPVLRRLLTFAPGTYTHAVSVANLAESACRSIGANYLLARVGAYYHDIGKLDQPDYYSENQQFGNRHDNLKPSLSASIIKAHVRNSVEKARALGLPQPVIDIIAQHHGTTLIRFFYEKAVSDEGLENVSPEDYYHGGPVPETKEAAVVMIADSVEAATRTLKKPTVSRLEKTVWSIMMDKFNSGQLDNCPLTFKDLNGIRKTFVRILTGHFHSRVEYPELKGMRA